MNTETTDNSLIEALHSSVAREELERLLQNRGGTLADLIVPPSQNLLTSGVEHSWSVWSLEFVIDHVPYLLNSPDETGSSPLHLAVAKSFIDACRLLLRRGANPNLKNKEGQTALHVALKIADLQIVALLLEFEADVTITWKDMDSIALASLTENQELQKLLHQHAAKQRSTRPEEDKNSRSFVERVLLGQMSALIRTRSSSTASKKKKTSLSSARVESRNIIAPQEDSPSTRQLPKSSTSMDYNVKASSQSQSPPPQQNSGHARAKSNSTTGGFFKKTFQAFFSPNRSSSNNNNNNNDDAPSKSSSSSFRSPRHTHSHPTPPNSPPSMVKLTNSASPPTASHNSGAASGPITMSQSIPQQHLSPISTSRSPHLLTSHSIPTLPAEDLMSSPSIPSMATEGLTDEEREALRSLEQVMADEYAAPLTYSREALEDASKSFILYNTCPVPPTTPTSSLISSSKSSTVNLSAFGAGTRFAVNDMRIAVECEVGRGATATVWKALVDDKVMAIKAVTLVGVRNRKAFRVVLSTEVQMMMSFSHPNIIRYHGEYFMSKQQEVHVLLDYVDGGSVTKSSRESPIFTRTPLSIVT
eukprot:TRINITY_DN401_c2_g1_i1.p1 TRINITY_DN401_c2_g1~~TRINITY_DN401_c2_g1_i1.p1  ORF type:complete len:610 (-),score=153.80 TRINITY_DN401_c2_g1_i1:657-2420(-)